MIFESLLGIWAGPDREPSYAGLELRPGLRWRPPSGILADFSRFYKDLWLFAFLNLFNRFSVVPPPLKFFDYTLLGV